MRIALLCLCLAAPVHAEPVVFPLSGVLELAEQAHLDGAGFARAIADILPLNTSTLPPSPSGPGQGDPFLWSISGDFGPVGGNPRPGAIFTCTRYGLQTRALFDTYGHAAPETFALLDYARPQNDDAALWPEAAVARLYCSFVWDDDDVVHILSETQARAGLVAIGPVMDMISDTSSRLLYGEAGFRLGAVSGAGDSVVGRQTARVTLTEGHQSVEIRGYLMGGGV